MLKSLNSKGNQVLKERELIFTRIHHISVDVTNYLDLAQGKPLQCGGLKGPKNLVPEATIVAELKYENSSMAWITI